MTLRNKIDDNVIEHVQSLMKKGVTVDMASGREFYTGYHYKTLYDWDQYFEAILQLHMGWETTYIENGIILFLDSQREDGFICRSIKNSQPDGAVGQHFEHCKPFLAQIVLMLYKNQCDMTWFDEKYYVRLKKYIKYWLNEKDKNGNYLPTWDSAPHTGMDNQHERAGWWFDSFCEGIDLASFLYRECLAFSKLAGFRKIHDDEDEFLNYAWKIKRAANQYMWNEEDGIYYDLDERTGKQIKVKHIGVFAALWAGIADNDRAKQLVENHLTNKDEFWRGFPVSSLAATEPGYSEEKLENDLGCSWRAQTWIPTNYYIFHGLGNYGYDDIAKELAYITYDKVKNIGDREYYNTESGTGNGLNPFWGWTLLAWFMPAEYENNMNPTKIDLLTPEGSK